MSPVAGLPHSESNEGYALLPKQFPGNELLGPHANLLRALADDSDEYPDDELRAIYWTVALENAFDGSHFASSVPGFRFATYGFANPTYERSEFGILVYTWPSDNLKTADPQSQPWVYQSDPNAPYSIEIGNRTFPIFVRQAEYKPHAVGVNPQNGTAACWAKSRRPQLISKNAVLTAKHILAQSVLGHQVLLTHGNGQLLDIAPEGVDAALIEVNPGPPNPLNRLRSRKLIAQWIDVDLHTQHAKIRTKVVEVNSSRGSLHYSLPLRVFLSDSAMPGDSGSLVTTPGGVGIGIYMGSVVNPATQMSEGFCQHLGQAASALQIDLWV
jgi:hypothetical protein